MTSERDKAKRWPRRFGIRTLLLVMLAGAFVAASQGRKIRSIQIHRHYVAELAALGGDWGKLEFDRDRVFVATQSGSWIDSTFGLDPYASPKQIFFGFRELRDGRLEGDYGIYKVDGDTLVMCLTDYHNPVPSEFRNDADGGWHLYEFKRRGSATARFWSRTFKMPSVVGK